MKTITKQLLVFLLSSLVAANAESALDDLSMDDDFSLDDQVASEDYPQPEIMHSGADYISDEENESTGGDDYKTSPSSYKKETIIYNAMLEALKRPEMSQQLGQVLPILRSMSPPQRLTLAALLTAQVMSSPTKESPTLDEVVAMFGVDPQDGEEKRKNMTSSLLIPLSLDIAKIFKGAAAKTPEALELRHLRLISGSPHRRIILSPMPPPGNSHNRGRPYRPPNSSHNRRNVQVQTEMVPPPPPPTPPPPFPPPRPGQHPLPNRGGKPRRPPPTKMPTAPLRPPVPERKHHISSSENPQNTIKDSCDYFTNTLCLEVSDYPKDAIMASIHRNQGAFEALLADIKQQFPEVTSSQETRYAPNYNAYTKNRRQDDSNSLQDFGSQDGYLCPSTVKYARPKRARATSGQWKFIVNTGDYTQTLRLEMCQRPHESCTFISDNFRSECAQVYNYHRLLTWDQVKGLHMDIFKVPTCCSCHVQGYSFNFPPRSTPAEHETSPRPEQFPGIDFAGDEHGVQPQSERVNEGFQADFIDDPNLRPPLLTNSGQFHEESFAENFNNDPGTRGSFNNNQIVNGGHFQNDPLRNQFQDQASGTQFNSQDDRTRNQFQPNQEDTRNRFHFQDSSKNQFQSETNLRVPFQSSKRETIHLPKPPELHVTPPPANFQVSSLFNRQGFRHPTNQDLIPPKGPPLPLAHETDFQNFPGNQLLRRSRNQTSLGIRGDTDLEADESVAKRRPYPNVISSDSIRIPSTTTTIRTTTTTTTTTTLPPITVPPKPSLTVSAGGKRVNYNYHPIIDYFKTQQIKNIEPSNTQDWTPIIGDTPRYVKDDSH